MKLNIKRTIGRLGRDVRTSLASDSKEYEILRVLLLSGNSENIKGKNLVDKSRK